MRLMRQKKTKKAIDERIANALVQDWARAAAQRAGKPTEFFWTHMDYQLLVPWVRELMADDALCANCGNAFVNELDIQLDHRDPPRHQQDWERLHHRNLWLLCVACHTNKGTKEYGDWLDEQEARRLRDPWVSS